jgi:hypothetical protein
VTTPGAISTSFVAAYIPKGQAQYTAYTTRPASGAAISSTNQAGSDSGGSYTSIAAGQYRYTFNTKAPSGFDTTVTHTIGIYGSRDLTLFNLGTNYAQVLAWSDQGLARGFADQVLPISSAPGRCARALPFADRQEVLPRIEPAARARGPTPSIEGIG